MTAANQPEEIIDAIVSHWVNLSGRKIVTNTMQYQLIGPFCYFFMILGASKDSFALCYISCAFLYVFLESLL